MNNSIQAFIQFKDVSKKYGNETALQKITFDIKEGEFVFITGSSGAGKTTILRLIIGDTIPTTGQVIVDNINVSEISSNDLPFFRQKIGTVFQDFKVLPERTVSENVEVALAVIGLPANEWGDRVNHVLKLVGLLKQADQFPSQLSGGEIQRVSLARALVVNPKLLLADEPTGNLDWQTSGIIMDILEKINKEGKTVIMATHNEELIKKHKKRIIHIENGRVKD